MLSQTLNRTMRETLDCCDIGTEPKWVIIKVDPTFDPTLFTLKPS